MRRSTAARYRQNGMARPHPRCRHPQRAPDRPPSTLSRVEMVRLLTTLDQFEARVLAARLGAEGVLWELRGGHDGPYPMGPVHVFVEASDLERARELLASTEA